ncbi:MAG: hypothetical protein A2096_02835 [Spirochaetes bacterium GWF1_41_5]|nr:MAG: hypothetical protein A2096_02835 [Spirochaetes bacterium GWF1_41_5]
MRFYYRVAASAPIKAESVMICIFFVIAVFTVNSINAQSITQPDEKFLAFKRNNVFEIIIAKGEDTCSYNKTPDQTQIPFAIRNDNYRPVGTAFTIDGKIFITAAHVFQFFTSRVQADYYLRDSRETVYKVHMIISADTERDYALFTISGVFSNAPSASEIDKNPETDQPVLAVGNAQGEGIIARDGVLTSKTWEEKNGRWKWLRFSAPASPGNSGGPLMSRDGKLLGIVLRKSKNENLNYALPINEVDFTKTVSSFNLDILITLPIYQRQQRTNESAPASLPMELKELKKTIWAYHTNFYAAGSEQLRQTSLSNRYPTGEGGYNVAMNELFSDVPFMIDYFEKSGKWQITPQYQAREKSLDGSALYRASFFIPNSLPLYSFAFKKKPDEKAAFLDNTASVGRLAAAVIEPPNYFFKEKILITGFGPADQQEELTDGHKRKWRFYSWKNNYHDRTWYLYTTETPDGLTGLAGESFPFYPQGEPDLGMKYRLDFLRFSLRGNAAEWVDFLEHNQASAPGFSLNYSSEQMSFNFADVIFNQSSPNLAVKETDVIELYMSDRLHTSRIHSADKNDKESDLYVKAMRLYQGTNRDRYFRISIVWRPDQGAEFNGLESWDRVNSQTELTGNYQKNIYSMVQIPAQGNKNDLNMIYTLGGFITGSADRYAQFSLIAEYKKHLSGPWDVRNAGFDRNEEALKIYKAIKDQFINPVTQEINFAAVEKISNFHLAAEPVLEFSLTENTNIFYNLAHWYIRKNIQFSKTAQLLGNYYRDYGQFAKAIAYYKLLLYDNQGNGGLQARGTFEENIFSQISKLIPLAQSGGTDFVYEIPSPVEAESLVNRGNALHRQQGDMQGALVSFQNALAADPSNNSAAKEIGFVNSKTGNTFLAIKWYEKARRMYFFETGHGKNESAAYMGINNYIGETFEAGEISTFLELVNQAYSLITEQKKVVPAFQRAYPFLIGAFTVQQDQQKLDFLKSMIDTDGWNKNFRMIAKGGFVLQNDSRFKALIQHIKNGNTKAPQITSVSGIPAIKQTSLYLVKNHDSEEKYKTLIRLHAEQNQMASCNLMIQAWLEQFQYKFTDEKRASLRVLFGNIYNTPLFISYFGKDFSAWDESYAIKAGFLSSRNQKTNIARQEIKGSAPINSLWFDCGGAASGYQPDIKDSAVSDYAFIGGKIFSIDPDIEIYDNKLEDAVFRTGRLGVSGFQASLATGRYSVRLLFCEPPKKTDNTLGYADPGRNIKITINSKKQEMTINPWSQAGVLTAYMLECESEVKSDGIFIELTADSQTILNGIQFVPLN